MHASLTTALVVLISAKLSLEIIPARTLIEQDFVQEMESPHTSWISLMFSCLPEQELTLAIPSVPLQREGRKNDEEF